MSNDNAQRDHPYRLFEATPEWAILDRAIRELVENYGIQETTAHEYIVGYLCKSLANGTDSISGK
jgi:hypothetical protein